VSLCSVSCAAHPQENKHPETTYPHGTTVEPDARKKEKLPMKHTLIHRQTESITMNINGTDKKKKTTAAKKRH
jgi:hypothetical protein